MNRYEFELLKFLEKQGPTVYCARTFSDVLNISGSALNAALEVAEENAWVDRNEDKVSISEKGLEALEPYRVQRAVIFAAGFGSRMVPVTLDTPKPLVNVNGKRIIDRLLDGLLAIGIEDITLVRGYKKECFDVLLEKYPNLKLVDNDIYNETNNISSAMAVLEKLDQCYICEADLLVANPEIIEKYQYVSNYLGSYSMETDDWCFDMVDGKVCNYRKGGNYCYNAYGISYWTKEDSGKLRADLKDCFEKEGGKDIFWEFVPLVELTDCYHVEIRPCKKTDITEIDNFYELVEIDPTYRDYPGQEA